MKGYGKVLCVVGLLLSGLVWVQETACSETNADIDISMAGGLLDISASNADLKSVLSLLAQRADISISFPSTLEKTITIHKQGLTLREAIESLSRGFNRVIVYSGPSKKKAAISEVIVLKRTQISAGRKTAQNRTQQRIDSYERQIESIRKRLARMDPNSSQGRRYTSRIKRIEKNIRRLKDQM